MEHIKCETEECLLIVTMQRGKANAMNAAMVEELCAAVEHAASDEEVRGFVIASDQPKFFSGGFDLNEVFQYDRDRMREFFGRFIDLYQSIYRLPKPTVAAVCGHAFAGGALLALACDFRVMGDGEFGFAVNEINLGVALPPGLIRLVVNRVGTSHARGILLTGDPLTPAQALQKGLASEVVDSESALDRAKALAKSLGEKPPLTFGAFKHAIGEAVAQDASANDRRHLDEFLDSWFSPEAEERKCALMESMKR